MILITILLLFVTACDGSSDDEDTIDAKGKWMTVLEEEIPTPADDENLKAKALLMDIDDDTVDVIFLDAETAQIDGIRATYDLDANELQMTVTHRWLIADPEDGVTWEGKGWYEIPDDADIVSPSFTIDGDTMTMNESEADFSLEKTKFAVSDNLTGTWKKGDDSLVLDADGSMSFTYGSSSGSGTWEASGSETGFLRQIYTDMSDDEDCSYVEYLSPYTLDGNTLTVYYDYTDDFSEDYMKE